MTDGYDGIWPSDNRSGGSCTSTLEPWEFTQATTESPEIPYRVREQLLVHSAELSKVAMTSRGGKHLGTKSCYDTLIRIADAIRTMALEGQ